MNGASKRNVIRETKSLRKERQLVRFKVEVHKILSQPRDINVEKISSPRST